MVIKSLVCFNMMPVPVPGDYEICLIQHLYYIQLPSSLLVIDQPSNIIHNIVLGSPSAILTAIDFLWQTTISEPPCVSV